MELVFYLFSCLMLFIIWKRFRDYLHPAFITVGIWLIIIFTYNFLIRKTHLWIFLSDSFYLVLIIYIFAFCIFSVYFSLQKMKGSTIESVSFGLKHKFFLYVSIICLGISNLYYKLNQNSWI